ncbi:hypothetical protein SASPL_141327 [Salvia splendens]|uniref:Rhamnogalacturonan lyase domain-containing protein n=1 Tax=Salvia splendens TaxID=180675 RepID=A0A8X8ZCP2_SALSN|nr:hypothetical protein SASPL_141327 [Salvia splendens]
MACTEFKIIAQTYDQIEVSFTVKWNPSAGRNVIPLYIDKRYIVLRGNSGIYTYAIFEHLAGWSALNIDRARLAFKLDKKWFRYLAISDERRLSPLVVQVDDKYQYSSDNKDSHVHGWISSGPHIFFSNHYAGLGFGVFLQNKEPWKKMFGSIFVYHNSDAATQPITLWQDAKRQTAAEILKWPYEFSLSLDFPHSRQRGSVQGRLFVHDVGPTKPERSAYVVFAPPGAAGSWQDTYKLNKRTVFIRAINSGQRPVKMGASQYRAGIYNLYASVPGIIGDFKHNVYIIIKPGSVIQIGNLVYNSPRNGPTLWEIGIPDRTGSEFYVPDPAPGLVNKLYISTQKKTFNNVYVPTTWQIKFYLKTVSRGIYTLRIDLVAAHNAQLQVWINEANAGVKPHFTTGRIGRENAIARHGIHARYWLFSANVAGSLLVTNRVNTIYIKQFNVGTPFPSVIYDYIRLEAPST